MIQGLYKNFDHWHQKGTVWLYSDPHFGDAELAAGIPGRPTDEEHIKLINSKVGKNDTLIMLGDIGDVKCVRQLKGYKVLICGNHDAGITNYQRKRVSNKYDADNYTESEAKAEMRKLFSRWKISAELLYSVTHAPFDYWQVWADNELFDEVYTGPLMIGEKLILSHEPIDIPWAFNIHGHIHDPEAKDKPNQFNVCADVIGYQPINFNQWMKEGHLANIDTIHRQTIDKATARKNKNHWR